MSLLGEEDPPFYSGEQFQPLPTTQPATHGTTAPQARYYRTGLRYYRGGPRYYHGRDRAWTRPDEYRHGAVEPLERYYRDPVRYYRMGTTVQER